MKGEAGGRECDPHLRDALPHVGKGPDHASCCCLPWGPTATASQRSWLLCEAL